MKTELEEVAEKFTPQSDKWTIKEIFIAGAKWQQEKMYSEEDLKRAFQVGFNVGYNDEQSPSHLTFDEWFEKFKKE
jgi:peptide subunit release factor 1 (eRF1)